MTEEKIKNILSLIKNTSSLTETEKQEWQGLLPMMNDKQLTELENILFTLNKEKDLQEKEKINTQNSGMPEKSSQNQGSPNVFTQTLSHIENMPKLGRNTGSSVVQAREIAQVTNPQAQNKPKNIFSKSLKEIIEEPELPAPKNREPKLILPPQGSSVSQEKSSGLQNTGFSKNQDKGSVKESKAYYPVSAQGQPKINPVKNPPYESSSFEKTKPSVSDSLKPPIPLPVVRTVLRPPKPVSNISQVKPLPKPKPQELHSLPKAEIVLDSIEKISGLTVEDYKHMGKDNFRLKFKQFIAGNDFFSARFALEKSPLFKSYLSSGAMLLKNGGSFSEAVGSQDAPSVPAFTQQEFEDFVDFLQESEKAG